VTLAQDDRVAVVEHDPADRRPLAGGREYGARVVRVTPLYIKIAYGSESLTQIGTDLFFADTGWRASAGACFWQSSAGEYRWRLRGPDGWLS
jgi:hypothetical protein